MWGAISGVYSGRGFGVQPRPSPFGNFFNLLGVFKKKIPSNPLLPKFGGI